MIPPNHAHFDDIPVRCHSPGRMRLAILTTDNREHLRDYELPEPQFGPAIEAVIQGLAGQPGLEVHVVSCTQRPMKSPEKIADNTWFHLLDVPKFGWLRTGYQGCIRAIRRKLRELGPDIVHGQGTERECALGAVFSEMLTLDRLFKGATAEATLIEVGRCDAITARTEPRCAPARSGDPRQNAGASP